MKPLLQQRFFLQDTHRIVATTLLLCLFLAACNPIQPDARSANPATTMPAPDLADRQTERWSSAAPDDGWTAEGIVALPKPGEDRYYTELRVKRADGGTEWMPVATWSNFGLGYTTPRPLHWSRDGQYLYFTNAPVVEGCGLFVNASDLQRLDLADGNVDQLLPPNTTRSLTFAPDDQSIAYGEQELLYLLDPTTGDYATLALDMLGSNEQWGNFVWSPDSQQVVFTIADDPCGANWQQSVVLVHTPSLTATVLVEPNERLFTAVAWPDPDHLQLRDRDNQFWQLDINTGEIVQ